jgi:hypothetical protein
MMMDVVMMMMDVMMMMMDVMMMTEPGYAVPAYLLD